MRNFYALLTLILLTSCATLFNGKRTKVKLYTPEHTTVNYDNETYTPTNGVIKLYPLRANADLKFTVSNDSISSDFSIEQRLSPLFFLNIIQNYGIGMLLDLTNDKRFTYIGHLQFEIDTISKTFRFSNQTLNPFNRHTFFLYTSPLKAIDAFSQPMLSLGAEYFFTDTMSFSAEYATVYTERLGDNTKFKVVDNKGRSFRYELKYYNLFHLTNNPNINEYIGLEARFIRYQFNRNIDYTTTLNEISYSINEPIAVQKSVDIFNLKYGLNFPIGKRFFLDLYSGFGVRLKRFKNPNANYNSNTDFLNEDDEYIFTRRYLEDVDDINQFNLSLGVKFGIKF